MSAAAHELEILSSWCERHLGAPVERVLFRAGYFSDVFGAALVDGRSAVVKVRAAGLASPEPLTPLTAYADGRLASAEALLEPWWTRDGDPLAVHDWDSLACLPEPAVAGAAAALYRDDTSVEASAAFLEHYEAVAGPWTDAQRRTAWAAGLWVRLFDAKKDVLAGRHSGFTAEEADRRSRRAFR